MVPPTVPKQQIIKDSIFSRNILSLYFYFIEERTPPFSFHEKRGISFATIKFITPREALPSARSAPQFAICHLQFDLVFFTEISNICFHKLLRPI